MNAKQNADEIVVFAGPCSIESKEQMEEVCDCVSSLGLSWIRGGAFKPRTSPYSFQGLEEEGLEIMSAAAKKYNLKCLSEVVASEHCELVDSFVDGLQIGARNAQNFHLLKSVGRLTAESKKLVVYKRGMSCTIEEALLARESITSQGNDSVVICERGIRTFETSTRYTLDMSAVPVIHKLSKNPVCVDVSHPAGIRDLVEPLALASIAAGCNSLMIEIHPDPRSALSDSAQQLNLRQFEDLTKKLKSLAQHFGKTLV